MSRDHIAQTRAAYGHSARQFAATVGTTVSPDFEAPIDMTMLDIFVELTRPSDGLVLDAGCGTGRIARYFADVGLDVVGVDIAPGMVDQARTAHPDIGFDVAELTQLPCRSGSVSAIAYWYSIITTPPNALDDVWAELSHALAPGGVALVAFQCGAGEQIHRPGAYGTATDLTLYHHDPDHVRSGIENIGLTIHTYVRRVPWFDHESTDQAFMIATTEV